jgi:hypothetical protein
MQQRPKETADIRALSGNLTTAWRVAIVVATGILPLGTALATALVRSNRLGRNRSGIGGASPEHCPGGILRLCINLRSCEPGTPGVHDRGLTGLAGQSALLAPPVSLQTGTALGVADGWLAKPLASNRHSTAPQQARLSR